MSKNQENKEQKSNSAPNFGNVDGAKSAYHDPDFAEKLVNQFLAKDSTVVKKPLGRKEALYLGLHVPEKDIEKVYGVQAPTIDEYNKIPKFYEDKKGNLQPYDDGKEMREIAKRITEAQKKIGALSSNYYSSDISSQLDERILAVTHKIRTAISPETASEVVDFATDNSKKDNPGSKFIKEAPGIGYQNTLDKLNQFANEFEEVAKIMDKARKKGLVVEVRSRNPGKADFEKGLADIMLNQHKVTGIDPANPDFKSQVEKLDIKKLKDKGKSIEISFVDGANKTTLRLKPEQFKAMLQSVDPKILQEYNSKNVSDLSPEERKDFRNRTINSINTPSKEGEKDFKKMFDKIDKKDKMPKIKEDKENVKLPNKEFDSKTLGYKVLSPEQAFERLASYEKVADKSLQPAQNQAVAKTGAPVQDRDDKDKQPQQAQQSQKTARQRAEDLAADAKQKMVGAKQKVVEEWDKSQPKRDAVQGKIQQFRQTIGSGQQKPTTPQSSQQPAPPTKPRGFLGNLAHKMYKNPIKTVAMVVAAGVLMASPPVGPVVAAAMIVGVTAKTALDVRKDNRQYKEKLQDYQYNKSISQSSQVVQQFSQGHYMGQIQSQAPTQQQTGINTQNVSSKQPEIKQPEIKQPAAKQPEANQTQATPIERKEVIATHRNDQSTRRSQNEQNAKSSEQPQKTDTAKGAEIQSTLEKPSQQQNKSLGQVNSPDQTKEIEKETAKAMAQGMQEKLQQKNQERNISPKQLPDARGKTQDKGRGRSNSI